jgi:hypothetical protein
MDTHLLDGLVGGVVGAMLAAVITVAYEDRRRKAEVALSVMERYLASFSELAYVKGFLQTPNSLDDPLKLNRVLAFGNWYDLVAALYLKNMADRKLLRTLGIDDEARQFRNYAETYTPKVSKLDDALKGWDNLRKMRD